MPYSEQGVIGRGLPDLGDDIRAVVVVVVVVVSNRRAERKANVGGMLIRPLNGHV